MDGTDAILATQGPTSRIAEYVKQLAGTEPHRYEQQRLLEPKYNAAPSQLLPIITTYAPNDIVLAAGALFRKDGTARNSDRRTTRAQDEPF